MSRQMRRLPLPEEPFVVVSGDKKEPDVVAAEGKEDIYNLF